MSQFKTYKELFNNIEDEWEWSYFMEDDFAGEEDTPSVAAEVDEIYDWNKTTTDDPMEAQMLGEVNEVYHKNGRYPTQHGYWTPRPRPQNIRAPFRGGWGNQRPFTPRYNNPRHLNTTVANQAYTFNGTTPHASVSYTPGIFNKEALFSIYQPVPYNHQQNQPYTQNQQYHNNSFVEKQNNATPQLDATTLIEKLQQLILMHTKSSPPSKWSIGGDTKIQHYMGPQSCHGITFCTGGSVRVTNCWRYQGIDPDSNKPRMPINNARWGKSITSQCPPEGQHHTHFKPK